jgi:hemoglobin
MLSSVWRRWASIGIAGWVLSGCGPASTPTELRNEPVRPPGEQTLYDRLGGSSAIYAITDQFINRAIADPRVNFQREGLAHPHPLDADAQAHVKLYWAQYLDLLAEGTQVYEGRNLADVHQGMDISEGEWLALLDDLKLTLEQFHIPAEQQKDLLTRVASTHDVIVNR